MSVFRSDRGAHRRIFGLVSAGVLAVGALAATPAADAAQGSHLTKVSGSVPSVFKDGRYIVLLKAPAAASYTGGTAGYARTASPTGAFQPRSQAVKAYSGYLTRSQNALASAAGVKAAAHYTIASNGFAAQMKGAQAADLAKSPKVLAVVPVEARSYDAASNNSANFLGMYGRTGVWKQHGTQADAGAGVVVGDLDTGIWPESDSFSGEALTGVPTGAYGAKIDPLGNTTMKKSDGGTFRGACELGEGWESYDLCSIKIIGARYYPDTFVDSVAPEHRSPAEFISTRDGDGHGSHTGSTAAGNVVDDVSVDGIGFGEVTGMAPGASIAAYKVCWEDDDDTTGGCYTDAIMSAIDDAVRDGVDVINFSISGALSTVVDPVEIAFAGAADAGIFVAASAGNSGSTPSTVAHNSPWLTTVAASTYRNFDGTVVLGDGTAFLGAMASPEGVPAQTPLIDAANAAADTSDAGVADALLCGPDSLDSAAVTGKIVVCKRGVYDRVAKSAEVARAGGVGVILVNANTAQTLNADLHSVPTVHVYGADSAAIYDYADTADAPTAALLPGNQTDGAIESAPLPQVAGFSSRGPALANESDILKPDIAAPGVDVLAAVAPPSNSDRDYDLYSGTSMAAPHIAGLGAFILGENPAWTPQMLQSAMMTTATPTKNEDGTASSDAFAQGSGNVTPTKMFKPGLFVNSTPAQWYGLVTHEGLDTGYPAVDPKAVNIPSMADHQVLGSTTFKRTLTSASKGTWKIKSKVPGFAYSGPKSVTFTKAGQSKKVKLTFTATDAAVQNDWNQGAVLLSGPTALRLPVALRPVPLVVPATITGTGTDSSQDVTVTSGIDGSVDLAFQGLAKADSTQDSVAQGEAAAYCVTVDADSTLLRIDLDSADDTADLDLLTDEADDCTGPAPDLGEGPSSATGAADESVTIEAPTAGAYWIYVVGYAAGEAGDPTPFRLDTYDLSPASTLGGLTATPDPLAVSSGEDATFTVSWTGLDPDARYLGILEYGDTGLTSGIEVSTVAACRC